MAKLSVFTKSCFLKGYSLDCYVGQAVIYPPNKITEHPVTYKTCEISFDVCVTLHYNVSSILFVEGVCGSSGVTCENYCKNMSEIMKYYQFRNCMCDKTIEGNKKLISHLPYVNISTTTTTLRPNVTNTTSSDHLHCYVGSVATTSPDKWNNIWCLRCAREFSACITLQFDYINGTSRESGILGTCGNVSETCIKSGCTILTDGNTKDEYFENCKCSDTKQDNNIFEQFLATNKIEDYENCSSSMSGGRSMDSGGRSMNVVSSWFDINENNFISFHLISFNFLIVFKIILSDRI